MGLEAILGRFTPFGASDRRGATWLCLLVATLAASNVVLHFPGTMSNDSWNQYEDAVRGRFSDWHPPVMAWLWGRLRALGDGPAPMLIAHLVLYWSGFGLVADALRRSGRSWSALFMLLAGAFPPFVAMNAKVIKDVGMAASFLAAVGLIFWFRARERRIHPAAGVAVAALLLYGALVRANAPFALGPLLVYALAPAAWQSCRRLIVAAILLAVVTVPATQELSRRLFQPVQMNAVHSLFLFDLVGIAAHEHDPALVAPRAALTPGELAKCYTPYWWDSFSPWGRCRDRVDRRTGGRTGVGEGLARQWLETIAAHPLAYAKHRLKHLNSSIFFAVPLKHNRLAPEFRADDPTYTPVEVTTERDIRFDLVRKNPLVWPVTWLVWGAFLLGFAAKQASTPGMVLARVLLVAALGYSGAYLLVGVATDVRYHYFSSIAVLVATLAILPELVRGFRDRVPPLVAGVIAVGLVVAIGLATRLFDIRWLVV